MRRRYRPRSRNGSDQTKRSTSVRLRRIALALFCEYVVQSGLALVRHPLGFKGDSLIS
jgi:hypothetical protein